MYKDLSLDRRIFKIMPFFPKLLSCPVYVHLAQFSYIHKTRFLQENARRKLMCQTLCCMLIVFSLRFVDRNRFSDQRLVYKANGWSGGGCSIDPDLQCWNFSPLLLGGFSYAQSTVLTSFTALAKVVDRLLFCILQLSRKGLQKKGDVSLGFRLCL